MKRYILDPQKIGINSPEFLEKYWQKHRVPGVSEIISQFVFLCRESVTCGTFTEQKAGTIIDFVLDYPKVSDVWPFTEFCAPMPHSCSAERMRETVLKIIDAIKDDHSSAPDDTNSIVRLDQFDIPADDLRCSKIAVTGKLEQMTREELERLLRISGAQIDKCVMPHTNLLIVGRKRSSGWKYENFGTKIRDAVNLKSRGHSILMLSEKSILRTLSSIQPSIGQNDHASWSEKLEEKILGLGILHVGATAARELAAYFRDLDKLRVASLDELIEVPGIGDKTAASILDWFQNAANQALIGSFVYPGVNFGESAHQKPVNCAFEGTSWVVTGTLSESREVFKELIQEGSGHVSNNISDTTTHLLVGERPGSKLKKAKGLGVKIIDESAFDEMLSPEP